MHAENDTLARCFTGDVHGNDPFKIKHLRDGGCSKTRPFCGNNVFFDRMDRIERIDRIAPVI